MGRLAGRDLRPIAALTVAEGGARLASFAFYVLAARVLAPADFGVLRYTLALALLTLFASQGLVTALLRELGAARGDPEATATAIGTSLVAGVVIAAAFAALAVVLVGVGVLGDASPTGLAVCVGALAVFQVYYAVGRGLGRSAHAVGTYLGGSLAQVAGLAVLAAVADPGPVSALVVFGVASLLPIVVIELVSPIVRGRALAFDRDRARDLWRIGGPLVPAEAAFLLWLAADQVWVANSLGEHELGAYGAAKTIAQAFIVLPAAVSGFLIPRIAELRVAGDDVAARRLVVRATLGLVGVTALICPLVIGLRGEIVDVLFGAGYAAAAPPLVGLSTGAVAFAAFWALSMAAVGWGRPGVYTLGVGAAALGEVVLLVAWADTATDAAWSTALSMGAGLVVVVLRLGLGRGEGVRPRGRRRREAGRAGRPGERRSRGDDARRAR